MPDTTHLLGAVLIGLGATLGIDLWGMLLKRGFGIVSLNYCLLGRWLLHIPDGTLVHRSIAAARPKTYECPVGWSAHYLIGTALALTFVLIASTGWLERPTLLPAVAFGVATVAMPWLVMQPSFGLGIASSRAPNPAQARLKSLMTHTVFGLGLYLWAVLLGPLLFA
ncbi:MAG TPA: DUF2938 domain-containing protein [Gemmatimonadales bacterium]|nr:DUF2938 domain-containing protein [Gemmatimonadales bacterium]